MKVIIIRQNLDAFVDEFLKITPVSLHHLTMKESFNKSIILSILHQHCILALEGFACLEYYSISSRVRDYIDTAVEHVILDRTESVWHSFSNALNGMCKVSNIKNRRKSTFEVSCE